MQNNKNKETLEIYVLGDDFKYYENLKYLPLTSYPSNIQSALIVYSLRGTAKISVHEDVHWIQPDELIILLPGQFVSFSEPSEDFLTVTMVISSSMFGDALSGVPRFSPHFFFYMRSHYYYSQNGDALDLESCKNALIVNSTFDVGDDGICLKSGKDEDGRRRGRVCENVVVDGCTVFKGHGGFVVGSEMSGGVRNVSVSNCQFLGTDVGLRFKSKRGRGGVVENIWIRNIAMMDIPTEPITFNLYYGGKSAVEVLESGEKVPAKVEPLPVDETTPCFRNIHVKNLVCAGARRALFFNGIPEMPIDGIILEDIDITSKLGAEFIYSKNINMKNVNIRNTEGEKIVTRYCEGIE